MPSKNPEKRRRQRKAARLREKEAHRCTGKIPHKDGYKAVRKLMEFCEARALETTDFCVYPCEFCGNWHVGGNQQAASGWIATGDVSEREWSKPDEK